MDIFHKFSFRSLRFTTNWTSFKVDLNQERYLPGQFVKLTLQIDNRKSGTSIKQIKGKLIQNLTVKTDSHKKREKKERWNTCYMNNYIGAGKQKDVVIEIPLPTARILNTTCNGHFIKNQWMVVLKFIYNKCLDSKWMCFCVKNPNFVIDLNLYNVPGLPTIEEGRWDLEEWSPEKWVLQELGFGDECRESRETFWGSWKTGRCFSKIENEFEIEAPSTGGKKIEDWY
jgi:hypothetical protein